MREKENSSSQSGAIPDDALEALARCLFPTMRSYFESEDGQREFAEWQARQGTEKLPRKDMEPDEKIRLAG